jgi:5-hydroxyisourate hydrolase
MPGLSLHAVDASRGVPARGMRIEVFVLQPARSLIAEGRLSASGAFDHAIATQRLHPGSYEVVFHAGGYFTETGVHQADPPFLAEVPFRFVVADADQHYHLPLKITPWGFSLFRGS